MTRAATARAATARAATISVGAFPRDPNPYQRLLYAEMAELGVEVTYLGELTRSRTLNLLLLPGELLVRRRRGLGIVHLHWVFGFQLPGRRRLRAVGLMSQAWFRVFLRTVVAADLRLVWTAHNVLPHSPVFWNDVRARRDLGEAVDLVIAHSSATLDALAELGIHPRATAIVPHGPFATGAGDSRESDDARVGPLTLTFVGAVEHYKGVDDLVTAFAALDAPHVRLVVAGGCSDPDFARRLEGLTRPLGDRVSMCLRRLSDDELDDVLRGADVLILPYRKVTTSGSAVLGLAAGLPLVVPDLPGLADLPAEGVFRYRGQEDLAAMLASVVATPRDRLRAMGSAGRASAAEAGASWEEIARTTTGLFGCLEHQPAPVT